MTPAFQTAGALALTPSSPLAVCNACPSTGAFIARPVSARPSVVTPTLTPTMTAVAPAVPGGELYVDTVRARTIIVTGASSSIGLLAARALASRPDVHVVMAVRNPSKAIAAAKEQGLVPGSYSVLPVDLSSLASVRSFVTSFQQGPYRSLSALICNAAIWHPRDKSARFTDDGLDETLQVNHLGHFLMANLLLPRLKAAKGRVVFLATQTHNPDTIPGMIPPQADLGDLSGLGLNVTPGTIDGKKFEPTKAYKDSKVCNVLTMTEMHKRFASDGVVVSAVFPGCIAGSELFREKRGWFRWFFPLFQKYVTRQFVSVEEAGRRVALLATDARFGDSGLYWQWRGNYLKGTADTVPTPIAPTEREADKAERLWEISEKLVGLKA